MFKICGFHSVHIENFYLLGYGTVRQVNLPAIQHNVSHDQRRIQKGVGAARLWLPIQNKNFMNTDYVYIIILNVLCDLPFS